MIGDLNDDQREAVLYDGHCLTTACPGSGKTRMLATKAAHILNKTREVTVCAVTFTRESALEIRSRIVDLAGHAAKPRLLAGTFHSLCFMQPAPARTREGFGAAIFAKMRSGAQKTARANIATEGDRRAYLTRAMEIAGLKDVDEDQALRLLEAAKSRIDSPSRDDPAPAAKLLHAYQDVLSRNGKIDFHDIVLSAVRGMRDGTVQPYPVDYLLVDEFQDTDSLQYEWIRRHAQAGSRITVVGDDDQSIYAFRAAMGFEGMERFAKECGAHRVVLGMNYRCRSEVLGAADALIRNNQGRLPKRLVAAKGPGGEAWFAQFADSEEEGASAADWCASWRAAGEKDLAVMARTNRRLDYTEAALVVRGIPYERIGGGSIFDRPEVSVFADILGLAAGASGFAGLDHVLSWAGVPEPDLRKLHEHLGKRLVTGKKADLERLGVEQATVETWWEFGKRLNAWRDLAGRGKAALVIVGIESWMSDRADKDFQVRLIGLAASVFGGIDAPLDRRVSELKNRRRKNQENTDAVKLVTMHGAKGLEWDRVWIVAAEEKVIPDEKSAVEEERRLMYVAMTRAREQLVVSASAKAPVSRFVWEAGLQRRDLAPAPAVAA